MSDTAFVHDGPIPGASNFKGKLVAVGRGFTTFSPDEAMAIVKQSGGHIASADKHCDMFIVSDKALQDEAKGKPAIFLANAREAGNRIVTEAEFWNMVGIDNGESGANRWVLVDPRMMPTEDSVLIGEIRSGIKEQLSRWNSGDFEAIKDLICRDHPSYVVIKDMTDAICKSAGNYADRAVENENSPAWDNSATNVSVAPYRLYIQRWTAKSAGKGAWNVVACGPLDDNGYPFPKPTICYHSEGDPTMAFLPDGGEKSMGATPWYPWRRNIGKVTVSDKWSPCSCANLFDGLERCPDFDLGLLDTSRATSMGSMFSGCSSVEYLMDIDGFDTSQVTSCARMFAACLSLRAASMVGWDVSHLMDVDGMFSSSPHVSALMANDLAELLKSGNGVFDSGTKTGAWVEPLS